MSLTVHLKGAILQNEKHQEGSVTNRTNHYFDELGINAQLGDGNVQLRVNVSNIDDLQRYTVTNERVARYIERYEFTCYLTGIERQTGRYKLGAASGRVFTNSDNTICVYLGSNNLNDLKALAQKIGDGEIWPEKIPQKEHIPAYKFYRKTYGVPALLLIAAPLLAWLIITVVHEDTYLFHKQMHNHGAIAMVWSMWGIVVSCLAGSRWVYLFSKDIKPVQRTILGVIVFGGLIWFIGCFYYMMFSN
jgi:hypothetical protein